MALMITAAEGPNREEVLPVTTVPSGSCIAIAGDPSYGRVICRCETITEAEIIEAIRRKPIPAKVEGTIHFAGLALLMVLMVAVTFQDITKLFQH